jgi:hypothetical protein
MKLRWLVVGLLSCAASGEAQSPDVEKVPLPPMDAPRIAQRVVAALRPAPGERAIIVYDPSYYPELARGIQLELTRAGVYPIAALTFDPPEMLRALAADPAKAKEREEQVVSLPAPVFEKADIFLWLPGRAFSGDLRWERLLSASRARGIHFHWISSLTGRSVEEIAALSRMYERAILETDYTALSAEQARLMGALRGTLVRVTTPSGTDLRLRVPRDAWFHKNDGDISPERARQARSVRDREMEFPSGALRFIPDVASVEGWLVLPRFDAPGGAVEGATLEFVGGRAARWQARRNEAVLAALRDRIGGDIDKVGEIVIGTNPLLVGTTASGDLPYYGYGTGYVRISMGDNWESGGTNRSPGGRPLWFFLERATLEADGTVLFRDGQPVK